VVLFTAGILLAAPSLMQYCAVFLEDPDHLEIEVAHVPGVTDRR
jgi:hypothetical protein